jgi:hypothetical protein
MTVKVMRGLVRLRTRRPFSVITATLKGCTASWAVGMTKQRIDLLDEARALVAKAMNHRCTTQDEFFALHSIMSKIDNAKSDWEWLEYERKQVAAIKRAERHDTATAQKNTPAPRGASVRRAGA